MPANNLQITVTAMVENGGSGSGVTAPVVKQVMDARLLNGHGRFKAEYTEPIVPLATTVVKSEPTTVEPKASALE